MYTFYVTVETEDGDYHYAVNAGSSYAAENKAKRYAAKDGEVVLDAQAELFNTFEHGDPDDYEWL